MIFTLTQATLAEREYLLNLRKLTMVEHLEISGQYLSDEEHEVRLDDHYFCSYLARIETLLVGTIKFNLKEDRLEIYQVQIHPQHQNKGYGGKLIMQVIEQSNAPMTFLTVLKANPAYHLYKRLGFEMVGEDEYEFHMQRRN